MAIKSYIIDSADGGNAVRLEDCAIRIEPPPSDECGGFLATVPASPAASPMARRSSRPSRMAHDAFEAWAMAEREDRGELPPPRLTAAVSCSAFQRASHRHLATRAGAEGVSKNQFAGTYLLRDWA